LETASITCCLIDILFFITLARMLLIAFTFTPHRPTHSHHHLKLHTRTFYTTAPPPQTWSAQNLQNCTTRLLHLRLGPHKTISSMYSPPLIPISLCLSFQSKQKLITPFSMKLYAWAKLAQNVDMGQRPGMMNFVVLSLTLFLPPLRFFTPSSSSLLRCLLT
jgi:hypothetical protein